MTVYVCLVCKKGSGGACRDMPSEGTEFHSPQIKHVRTVYVCLKPVRVNPHVSSTKTFLEKKCNYC